MKLPRLLPVLQRFPHRGLPDLEAAVREQMRKSGVGAGMPAGSPIAVAAGSRGIANLSLIVRTVVSYFRELGLAPFVFPAMGSHGGATAEGQADVLAHYGVTEAEVGCPIVSSLEVVELGPTPEGIQTYMDRKAFESAGVFLVNRIKWHTTYEAPVESGLMKMAAVGLGKLQGATNYHQSAVRLGLGTVMRSAGRRVLESGKVLGGLAILEGAHHETAEVVALRADEIDREEEALLKKVQSWMPRILFPEVDILIVDEIGKHISGVGMDSKVVNRHPYGGSNLWSWAPRILRIYVRDLSPLSYGNAIGVGMADAIPQRLYDKIDWVTTKVNATTSSNMPSIRTPVREPSDYEALKLLARTVGRLDSPDLTCVWIRNTLELTNIVVTESLALPDGVEATGPAVDWEFDADGYMVGSTWN